MVAFEIPKHYTVSPSSFTGTPQLTINREAIFDLDSSNAFEGPEKLLEVWFAPSADALPSSAGTEGLKAVSATKWTEMLDLVHCKVLSIVESDHVDAYLLSESSMFVFPHKLILKTCGTTTLLSGLPTILEIAALNAGFPHSPADPETGAIARAAPYRVFYSRKNFLNPEQQRGPHRSWRDEVRALDRLFLRGSAYMIGKMNGEHWYLYITEPLTQLTPPTTPEHERLETQTTLLQVPGSQSNEVDASQDETLEILMTDLEEKNAKKFYLDHASAVAKSRYFENLYRARKESKDALDTLGDDVDELDSDNDIFAQTPANHFPESPISEPKELPFEFSTEGHALGTVVSEICGLADVYPKNKYPDAKIDAYMFEPCGFSANGVIPAPSNNRMSTAGSHYFTVHVTPEPHCSYASFETNVPSSQTGRQTREVIEQVVSIFKPGRFSVTVFEAKESTVRGEERRKAANNDQISGYRRVDRILHDLDGYDLVFRYFERLDWQGGAPRLGENY